jgi:taurine dioxygenase
MLYGVAVPATGGDTQFTSRYAAYDDLPEPTKRRIAGLRVSHRCDSSRKGTRIAKLADDEALRLPDVTHRLVRTHPHTGRKALYKASYQYRHIWRQGAMS